MIVKFSSQNLSKSEYDVMTIENVKLGKNRRIDIVPVLYIEDNPNVTFVVHGAYISETYQVGGRLTCIVDISHVLINPYFT